jgi:hypothetical protein
MATTIVTKSGSGAPTASDLVAGELAVDLTNKRLYTEDSGGTVLELGTNPASDVTFGDNTKAIFGAGSDLQIYHDGNHSYIEDAGTGSIKIKVGDFRVENASGNNLIKGVGDVATLHHAGSEKLATTATGIDVTGTVTATGNVGIGGAPLANNQLLLTDAGTYSQFHMQNSTSGSGASDGFRILMDGVNTTITNHETGYMAFETQNTERMRIDSSGNVGIGTSSPYAVNGKNLTVRDSLISRVVLENSGASGRDYYLGSGPSGEFNFYDITAAAERMRIDSSGNVGIGTSSPNGNGILTLNTPADNSAQIVFAENDTAKWLIGHRHDGDYFRFYDLANSAERMRIDSSGNLGIGVVPSAWGSSTPALQILNGSIYGYGTYESGYSTNLYYDGGWKHISTQVASQYRQTESGHQWFNAASASAGATATMVQAMTLDASGNLLVGTTTSGATKLKVVGEASEYAGYFEYQSSGYGLGISNVGGSGSTTAIFFFNTNGAVGSIATSGSATTYNTSSDERLKENIADADDAGSKIDAIQVRKFDWKADGSHQDYGMVAQELLEVAPEAVSQGETEEEMMGVDYSKLVPMMLKEIQSLRQRIAALES